MKATVNPVDQHVVTLTIEVPAAEVGHIFMFIIAMSPIVAKKSYPYP